MTPDVDADDRDEEWPCPSCEEYHDRVVHDTTPAGNTVYVCPQTGETY